MNHPRRRMWRLEAHDLLPSTSDVCRQRALEGGAPDGLAVLARQQSSGRGTNGRTWRSPAGNLYLSVLLRPEEPARVAAQWSLLSAVAVAETIAAHLPAQPDLALKWPNDVLLRGRKTAGILTEMSARADGMLDYLVIGVGVNLAVAPGDTDRPTACLAECAPPPAPEAFARSLLDAIDAWDAVRAREGFSAVRAAWLARGPVPGMPLQLRFGTEMRYGRFAGLAPDGGLLLATEAGVRAFAAGEVMAPQTGGG